MDPPIENGIAINFGTMDFCCGKVPTKEKVRPEPKKVQSKPVESVKEQVDQKQNAPETLSRPPRARRNTHPFSRGFDTITPAQM